MENRIISYIEMCEAEGLSLQRGMNYNTSAGHSVILMSTQKNAPYNDKIDDGGTTLIYEGHDAQKSQTSISPKRIDQPAEFSSGKPTENKKFFGAAIAARNGLRTPERVKVYEKIKPSVWSDNGFFALVDAWIEYDGHRNVYKFKLIAAVDTSCLEESTQEEPIRRVIPSAVQREVWKRDHGQCRICGAKENLHFDHIIPFSKGGSSLTAENIQLLCAHHNLQKSNKI